MRAGETIMKIMVWDRFVRFFHWTLVAVFVADYFFLEGGHDYFDRYILHDWLGYLVFALVVLRIVWGFVGTKHARFSDFVPTPAALLAYARSMLSGRKKRYLGHNPAGAVMVITFLALTLGICITGWMHGLDAFWGEIWVNNLHYLLSDIMAGLIVLHVLAAFAIGWLHRESLVLSMITGSKQSDPAAARSEPDAHAQPATPTLARSAQETRLR
jgi:cytochrome b